MTGRGRKVAERAEAHPGEDSEPPELASPAESPSTAPAPAVLTPTADLAILTARTHADATLTGLDPSRNMLAVGAEKLKSLGLDGRVTLVEGEAERLPFEALPLHFGPHQEARFCRLGLGGQPQNRYAQNNRAKGAHASLHRLEAGV